MFIFSGMCHHIVEYALTAMNVDEYDCPWQVMHNFMSSIIIGVLQYTMHH